jgi:hypothetical protein
MNIQIKNVNLLNIPTDRIQYRNFQSVDTNRE